MATDEQDCPRCPHCDDTGDVHRADGEWLGICSCAAGDRIRQATPAPKEAPSEASRGEGLTLTQQFWVDHRAEIIAALDQCGLQIMSTADRLWLEPVAGTPGTPGGGRP